MDRKQVYIISFLVLLSAWVELSFGLTKSACFSGLNKTMDLDCGPGHLLHITRAFYGFSPTGQCRLLEESQGCITEDKKREGCIGQRACSINLPTGQWGVNVPSCGQRSNYYQVEYNCVKESSVYDICKHSRLTEQSGYITTPGYPNNYHKQGKCDMTITVNSGQKIRLLIIDLQLEARGKQDCADYLYFNDKLRSITLCYTRTNHNYTMHSNFLHLELQSTSRGQSKGFWLYYEAFPPLATSMVAPDTSNQVDDNTNNNEPDTLGLGAQRPDPPSNARSKVEEMTPAPGGSPGSTVPLYRDDKDSGKKLPFAAIAGGVIGTLSLILLVLLLLLFIKWCKERRYQKAEKILEIRNPAFRSSNDFHDAQAHSGYYC